MVAVLMPAYNEEEIIEKTVQDWHDEVTSRIPGAELIVVNDCSKDATGAVLANLSTRIPELRVLTPPANGGHGKALRYGFDYLMHEAKQDWVFQTDSDQQHLPSDFWKLWNQREASDFVLGIRSKRADGPVRVIITSVMRITNFLVWGLWIRDANCPFKLMRRSALQNVLLRVPRNAFIPMVMVSISCRKMKYRVTEVVVEHLPRLGGEQSLSGLWKWTKVGSRCLRQLLVFRMQMMSKGRDIPQSEAVIGSNRP
jgi:dolichol-phosphate mannosyltransferase